MKEWVIWGAGYVGRRIIKGLGQLKINAYVDSSIEKQGGICCGEKIISPQMYFQSYRECYVLIATGIQKDEEEIIALLKSKGINHYFLAKDMPSDLYYPRNWKKFPFERVFNFYKELKSEKKIVIAGATAFGLMTYEFLERNGYKNIFIFDKEKSRMELRKDGYKFFSYNDCCKRADFILLARNDYLGLFKNNKTIPFYKFTFLKENSNETLKVFKNKHKNDNRCFIVATGPSVKIGDLDRLRENKEKCFSVNDVFKVFNITRWRPDYLVATDTTFFSVHDLNEVSNIDVNCMLLADHNTAFWNTSYNKKKIYKFHPTECLKIWDKNHNVEFSDDLSQIVITCATVVYACLQFACYMGFKKIYIIGADCEFKGDEAKNYYFVKNYNEGYENIRFRDDIFEEAFIAYKSANMYAKLHGIEIYNATRGGKLEVFPRVDFDSLFFNDAKDDVEKGG